MMTDCLGDGWVTMNEAEFLKMVGISRVTAWRLREKEQLPHRKIGRRVLYTCDDVDAFLKRSAVDVR